MCALLFGFVVWVNKEAVEKVLHLLDMQRVCQLNTLLTVVWHFWKARICRLFSSFLLGFVGLGFFLVAMGFGRSTTCVLALVQLNFSGTMIVAWNLDEYYGLRDRCIIFSP